MSADTGRLAVIFDMDGVIVDNNLYHKRAWNEYARKFNISLTEDEFKKHVAGRTNKDILSFFLGRELSDDEVNKYGGEKEELYRELYKPEMKLPEGLLHFLESLKSNGISIALATSAPRENIDFVFDNLHIGHFFDAVVDESQVSRGKPDPEVYLKAAGLLKLSPGQCVVIEDSIPGIMAGAAAGMAVVAITTTHSRDELKHADLVIDTFKELDIEKLIPIIKEG